MREGEVGGRAVKRGDGLKRIILACMTIVASSCAVVQPPSGGPEDREPPHVVSIVPAPDSAGAGVDTEIILRFSEKVDGDTFKERLRLYPPVEFEEIEAKGDVLRVRFGEALPETTIAFVLSGGYADMHGVRSKESFISHFSTEEEIQEGIISGKVFFKSSIEPHGVVKLHRVIPDSTVSYKKERESRIAFAGEDGGFAFRALPTDGTRFILWAFSDENDDGLFAEQKEFHLLYPDTIGLTPSRRAATEIFIDIIDPDEPGVVTGIIIDETGLGGPATMRFEPLLPGEPPIVVRADSTGGFAARKVPPGRYLLHAFVDLAPDSLCGAYTLPEDSTVALREPCVTLPDTLVVEPGD
ncbi:MAG TPA: hypothetical protein ENO08_03345, partial [Candidatus Eisenbacteria bacterium]|nr:hypothetical protein [Candidatus Eisenbacteria bacterium]